MRLAPFLFLVTTACGTAVTLVDDAPPSSRDRGAVVDRHEPRPEVAHELRRGEPDVGCHCALVRVSCSGGGEMYAHANRQACTLALPTAVCDAFDLEEGSSVDPEALLAREGSSTMDADEAFDFCTGKHEASHACDGPAVASCASEVQAYRLAADCMRGFARTPLLDRYIDASEAAADLNACVCGGGSCDACREACVAAYPDLPSTCADAADAYCR